MQERVLLLFGRFTEGKKVILVNKNTSPKELIIGGVFLILLLFHCIFAREPILETKMRYKKYLV